MHKPSTVATSKSTLTSVDARVKLVFILLFVSVVALSTELRILLFSLSFVFVLLAVSRVPAYVVGTRFLLAAPFVVFASLSLYLAGSTSGAIAMSVRVSTCVLAVVLLSATTPLLDLIEGLKRLRLPGIILVLVLLTHRYIHVFIDEMGRIRMARKARGGKKGHHILDRRFMEVLSVMVGMVVVRALWRGDRVHQSLLARHFRGDLQLNARRAISRADVGFALSISLVSVALALANLGVILWI
jgi:cobalt/nickel transport system permease protein